MILRGHIDERSCTTLIERSPKTMSLFRPNVLEVWNYLTEDWTSRRYLRLKVSFTTPPQISLRSNAFYSHLVMDSMAKIKSGFLSGEYADFGKWDQCIETVYDDHVFNEKGLKFGGKFCLYGMHWPQPESDEELAEVTMAFNNTWLDDYAKMHRIFRVVPMTNALCFPSVCSKEEIQTAVQFCKLPTLTVQTQADPKLYHFYQILTKPMCPSNSNFMTNVIQLIALTFHTLSCLFGRSLVATRSWPFLALWLRPPGYRITFPTICHTFWPIGMPRQIQSDCFKTLRAKKLSDWTSSIIIASFIWYWLTLVTSASLAPWLRQRLTVSSTRNQAKCYHSTSLSNRTCSSLVILLNPITPATERTNVGSIIGFSTLLITWNAVLGYVLIRKIGDENRVLVNLVDWC